MKIIWIVCWRGLEEEFSSLWEALERWGQLYAFGRESEVFEVLLGGRKRIG